MTRQQRLKLAILLPELAAKQSPKKPKVACRFGLHQYEPHHRGLYFVCEGCGGRLARVGRIDRSGSP